MMVLDVFEHAFNVVIGHEAGLSRDRRDRGNWTGGAAGKGELRGTKFGVSAAAYPKLDIAALTLDQAKEIYRRDYWERLRCDELPRSIALVLFDSGVNAGVKRATQWLQRAVGVAADGVIGPQTLAAVRGSVYRRVLEEMLALRNEHNRRAATAATHGLGWSRRLFHLAFEAASLAGDDGVALFP